ncbi:MAG: division/cell wall cluster transcriptional repressor MraZ [Planctomycetota bacterium]
MFLGEFDHSLDAKQRLAIPAEFRDAWHPDEHGQGLVAVPGAGGTLELWPERTFQSVVSTRKREFVRDPKLVQFERAVFSKAAKVPFDSAGRIRIPDRLLQDYGLSGKVTVVGMFDHLEVVDTETWRKSGPTVQQTGALFGEAFEASRRNPSAD